MDILAYLILWFTSPIAIVGYIIIIWLVLRDYFKKRKTSKKKDLDIDLADNLEDSSVAYKHHKEKNKVK